MEKKNNKNRFFYKETFFERRLKRDVLKDGTAVIPCQVEGLSDIISKYSIDGVETMDPDFTAYVVEYLDCIPAQYPVVLRIFGPKFSEDEKKTIRETIASDGDYELGMRIEANRHHRKVFWWMVVGTIISAIVITLIGHYLAQMPEQFLFVIFWLFADTLVRYIFLEWGTHRAARIRAGRVASIQVEFVED